MTKIFGLKEDKNGKERGFLQKLPPLNYYP